MNDNDNDIENVPGVRNPFSVPEDEWDWDINRCFDLTNMLNMGIEVLKVKCAAEADCGLYDLANIAAGRISSGRLIYTSEVETACVMCGGLYINPEFFRSLTPPERIGVLLHESSHVDYRHGPRFEGKDHDLANIAADLAINSMLRKWSDEIKLKSDKNPTWPFVDLFKMPEGILYPDNPDISLPEGWSAEDYYTELLKKWQQQGGGGGHGDFPQPPQPQPGSGKGGGGGGQQDQSTDNSDGESEDKGGQTSKLDDKSDKQDGQGGGNGDQSDDKKDDKSDGDGNESDKQDGDDGDGKKKEPKPEDSLDRKQMEDAIEAAKKAGLVDSRNDNSAFQSQMNDAEESEIEKARQKGMKDLEQYAKDLGRPGMMTPEDYKQSLEHPTTKEGQRGKESMSSRQQASAGSGLAKRGVDGKVQRADDDAMWWDILDPLTEKELTDKTSYSHHDIGPIVVADSIGSAVGTDTFLKGRVEGYTVGGEVLMIIDTSGSTMDYWKLSVSKCLECLSALEDHAVVLRVVLFSSGVSLQNEYIFYNSDKTEEGDLDVASILRPGKDVLEEHIVDLAPLLGSSSANIREMVGSTIVGGGGTELLPIVGAIENTVGKDEVAERFLVTVIVTDAALYGPDVTWAQSNRVFETFGDHVCWMFLDLYNEDYSKIQGEKKYLIACR